MNLNTCICGDCLQWMASINDPFADLIIADPPFNINFKYDTYQDNKSSESYLLWCHDWINQCKRLLHNDGNLLICMGDEYVSNIDILCKQLGLYRRNWMIWNYTFGQSGILNTRKGFTRSKTHILRYTKHKSKFYFNAPAVAIPSARSLLYSDKRADKRGKCPDDVFTTKRVAGTHVERVRGVSTQMPTKLLKIWIAAMCKPEGVVFDPFAGSGSSLIAAKMLGQQYLGVELSPNYHQIILNRLSQA